MKYRIILILNIIAAVITLSGCKKLVEVDGPTTGTSIKTIFTNDATAVGALTAIYANMSSGGLLSSELTSLSCIAGLSADELTLYSTANNLMLSAYYKNALNSQNISNDNYWTTGYKRIFMSNAAVEGLNSSTQLTPSVKNQLLGEAKFMRAFNYFYLVNLYGAVPLILNTDYTINSLVTKNPKVDVYKQIITDLKDAQQLLSDKYVKGDGMSIYSGESEERVRPNKWAATALLARTYLFTTKWSDAEAQASLILSNSTLYRMETLNNVFLKNNKEAIWQLQPVTRFNTEDARLFSLLATGPTDGNPVYLSNDLIESFDQKDQRKVNWISNVTVGGTKYYYANKYKNSKSDVAVTEYSNIIRLAEQYLIRAEARAQQGDLVGSIKDINVIRERAGLDLLQNQDQNISKDDLLNLILKERRFELFTEWGHRWFDLKRLEKIDNVMKVITFKKGNSLGWRSYQQLYPISQNELRSNPNLIQNIGF